MKKEVKLSYMELRCATEVGSARYFESIAKGRKSSFPESNKDELLLHHIHGAMAEMAYAKMTGQYWAAHINRFHKNDLPEVEVRYSTRKDLRVRKDDNKINVVKITGLVPTFRYVGYIFSESAKQQKWKKDPGKRRRPAYFVPDSELIKDFPQKNEIQLRDDVIKKCKDAIDATPFHGILFRIAKKSLEGLYGREATKVEPLSEKKVPEKS